MSGRPRVGLIATHPIQYYSPWYRALARLVDLHVYYCHRQGSADQARTAFGVAFEWDVPLLDGYDSSFLTNVARQPDVSTFAGCDTPAIGRVIRAGRFDAFIVPGWYTRSYWQAILACWGSGTPVLVRGDSHLLTPRSRLKRLAKEAAYRAFIPRFAGYLVVGERNRDYYLHYGADPRRMFFAPHAVDNQYFAAEARALRPRREQIRAAWGLPADAAVFLFAGKLAPHKRPADFVRAVAEAGRADPRVWGLVAGDGPQRAELEQEARALGAPVRFAGFLNQSQMPRAYVASDAVVMSSDETWGLVVNEAMASGLPAVVCDRAGCAPDLIVPGATGAVFPYGEVAALSAALGPIAAQPGLRERLGAGAARHIQRYTVALAAQGTLHAVRHVVKPRG